MCLIYQQVFNLPPETKVPIAPPREALSKYGGKLSYEMYHNFSHYNQVIEIYKLPLIPVLLHISELSRSVKIDGRVSLTGGGGNIVGASPSVNKHGKTKKYIPVDPEKVSQAIKNVNRLMADAVGSANTIDKCFRGTSAPPGPTQIKQRTIRTEKVIKMPRK